MRSIFFLITCCLSLFSQSIDVIIPIHKKDKGNLDVVIDAVKKNIIGCRRIIIVSKEKFTNRAEWIDEKDYPFSINDVGREIGGEGGVGRNIRRGWYYQQLLKFYSHYVIDDLEEHVLILDGDTVPTHPMEFIDQEGKPYIDILTTRCGISAYYLHLQMLLPEGVELYKKGNPVVHHMVFSRSIIDALFIDVEDRFNKPFWKVFLNLVPPPHKCSKSHFYAAASEYMIYYHFCKNFCPEKVHIRYIKSCEKVNSLTGSYSKNIDFVSHHNYDRED